MTRAELRREIDGLRALLGLNNRRTIDEWEAMPQDVRDGLAARAFVAESGDATSALARLGFSGLNKLPRNSVRIYADYVSRIFGTAGVRAILKRDLAAIDNERAAMLARQVKVALHGRDGDAVRAFEGLVKVCGWAFLDDSAPDTQRQISGMSQPVSQPHPNSTHPTDVIDEKHARSRTFRT
ncbi:MAG TPA: hypothetical protein VEW74_10520 [Candidatus Nitrosotalea sp.]|nr:hypothetical protein [Candidatus Nitrosotalea sp.]